MDIKLSFLNFKKLLNWRFLLTAGIVLWVILLLISVVAVLVRIIATILIIFGAVDLAIYFFRKKEKINENSSR